MNFNDYRELLPSYIDHNKRVSTMRGVPLGLPTPVLIASTNIKDIAGTSSFSQTQDDEVSIIGSTPGLRVHEPNKKVFKVKIEKQQRQLRKSKK
jgi:hypothetical protein